MAPACGEYGEESETKIIWSGNPIITHIRAADPSAEIWEDGQVWLYTSQDMEDATSYLTMDGYHAFSSSDMVEWTDHGEILHSRDVSWTRPGLMLAPDACYRDGIYYLYFPTLTKCPTLTNNLVVGVATSNVPEGPFTALDAPMEGPDGIDPTCFIDDDGQAYLYWGQDWFGHGGPKMARLADNMVELAEEPREVDYGFDNFVEGSYMHKRNGIYYFSYSSHQGYYSMGSSPYGPFEYAGVLNAGPPGAQDHHSMIQYHGQWYYFYHRGDYNGGDLYRRNVCVDYLYYNDDGTIQMVIQTEEGVREVRP
jgi:hypothetical protein